ncbi:MAG: hypothetical protein MJA83_09065 [Gammaproteobacteria bacterium]|nr:hypothetical protein [Gammaproteobacteria bacterium]
MKLLSATIVITVLVLGARTEFVGSLQVGIQRLAGALFGGTLCLAYFVLLLDWATSILSLMIIVFVVSWFCLLLISVPSISYLGFQLGFVFTWGVGDPAAPTGDVWVPRERMAQVAMGSAMLFLTYKIPLQTPGFRAARARSAT